MYYQSIIGKANIVSIYINIKIWRHAIHVPSTSKNSPLAHNHVLSINHWQSQYSLNIYQYKMERGHAIHVTSIGKNFLAQNHVLSINHWQSQYSLNIHQYKMVRVHAIHVTSTGKNLLGQSHVLLTMEKPGNTIFFLVKNYPRKALIRSLGPI
jgi:hypothetical protein